MISIGWTIMRAHCEWEGDADGEENAWYCKYSEDDETGNLVVLLEDQGVGWHCTDDFGQRRNSRPQKGEEWSGF
ncbi:MAG: hypothetical protein CM1200mP32_02290 [Methanobacteriota archaeon]|nr:MAG: hypothetical protein CM1200mP32_02290 [Euryarchaeota archaeon]